MKAVKFVTIILLILSISASAKDFRSNQPLLITAAGQSQDVTIVKILAQKAGLKFSFDKLVKTDQLKDHATLVFVTGGSTKGLGAANIDKDQELERVNSLIEAAKKAKMAIVTMHVGGSSRRGKLSDEFNKLTAENADCLIIVRSGDEDKLFSKIAGEKKIPIFLIDKIFETEDVLKKIFVDKK